MISSSVEKVKSTYRDGKRRGFPEKRITKYTAPMLQKVKGKIYIFTNWEAIKRKGEYKVKNLLPV